MSGGGDRLLARMSRHAALRVDDGDLPHVLQRVGRDELRERVRRRDATLQQLESALPIPGIDERLRGNGARAGFGPGDDRSHGEPVGLHGHAELARLRVACDDRVGVRERIGDRGGREGKQERKEQDDVAHGVTSASALRARRLRSRSWRRAPRTSTGRPPNLFRTVGQGTWTLTVSSRTSMPSRAGSRRRCRRPPWSRGPAPGLFSGFPSMSWRYASICSGVRVGWTVGRLHRGRRPPLHPVLAGGLHPARDERERFRTARRAVLAPRESRRSRGTNGQHRVSWGTLLHRRWAVGGGRSAVGGGRWVRCRSDRRWALGAGGGASPATRQSHATNSACRASCIDGNGSQSACRHASSPRSSSLSCWFLLVRPARRR